MAVDLTLKSVQITNREATPRVLNSPQNGGDGVMHEVYGHIASVTAALSITSVIRLCSIPSNARVNSVKFHSAAQGAGAFDIGIYQTNSNGGAVVDADLFGSAISAASQVKITEILEESAEFTVAEMAKPLWEVLMRRVSLYICHESTQRLELETVPLPPLNLRRGVWSFVFLVLPFLKK